MSDRKVPPRLTRAIHGMASDTPASVVAAIEEAGYVIVPKSKIVELRRSWWSFMDDQDVGFDRLYRAVAAILS